ncbi:P-loop containing nucleoside triphosphate hydrolase protein [Circinella umbellata]|nr:P-loop containing nucleoside triphosphate hydrolase protein [Circinella umbellata]
MPRRSNSNNKLQKQLVIIGDGACGKTSLLIVYSREIFPEVHIPTVFETYVKEVEIDNKRVELALWDTAGQETFDRLRTLAYPDSDVIVIAFSIGDPETLENVEEKWVPEVAHHCPRVPTVLVGCKKDLRNDPETIENLRNQNLAPVSWARGLKVMKDIGASNYVECSAKLNDNVNEVFIQAIRATFNKKISCKIL